MLQTLREKTTGWIAALIVILLVIPFAFFGIENYMSPSVSVYVAKVGEAEISPDEFRTRFEEYRRQMRQMLGDRFDGRMFDQPEIKRQMLDRLVEEQLLLQAGERMGLTVPPARLQKEILQVQAFQRDGKFDPDLYRMMLQGQNMSPRQFEERVRRDLEVQALSEPVSRSAFVTEAYVHDFLRLRDQRRDIAYVLVPPPGEDTIEAPDDAAIEAFHAANAERYQTDEQVTIEYLEVDAAGIEVPTVADEESLRRRYEEQGFRFREPEQRLLSHILVSVAQDADADAQRAAREKLDAIVARLAEPEADFAAIAREASEDIGSKSAGGDLGWIERGMTDPAFETAAFAQQAGSVGEPVQSAEGWHLIQVREVRAEVVKPFEAVRAELEREYLESERERAFSELSGKLVDLVYRDPTTLAPAARELGLEIRREGPFSRTASSGIAANPAVREQAFSSILIGEGTVSDSIELEPNHIAVIRVAEHFPAKPLPLEDVRDRVRADIVADRLAAAATAAAEALETRLAGGESLADVAASIGAEVVESKDAGRSGGAADPAVVREAFELPRPAEGAASRGLASLGGNRYALVEVQAVRDGDPNSVAAAEREALRSQLGQALSSIELRGLLDTLRRDAEVRIAEDRM